MDDIAAMVVAIVAISCAAGVINNYLKTRRAAYRRGPGDDVAAELEAPKERIAVLEEIVTDERYHLQRELDRLERRA